MLYRKGNHWALCPFKVKYTQHGQPLEQFIHDKEWWFDFEAKWDHTTIEYFEDVKYSSDEISRLEEVKYTPDGFHSEVVEYVKNGRFPDRTSHPLRELQNREENEQQGQDLSEREINEMMLGIQMSDVEIRLMMGGL